MVVNLNKTQLENVNEYIYLVQQIQLGKGNKDIEIERRIRLG